LPALASAALTVALSWLIGLLILGIAGLRAFLSRLTAPAVLPIALLAAIALLSGTLARTLPGARILVGLLGIDRIGILRLCILLVVARLTATNLSAALGSLARLPFTGLAIAGLLRCAPLTSLTFAALSLSLTPARLTFIGLPLAGLILCLLISGLGSLSALAAGLPLAGLSLSAALTLARLRAFFSGPVALAARIPLAVLLAASLFAIGAGLAIISGITGDFLVEFVGQLPQLVAGAAQGFGFVSQNRFGGPLDPFAKLTNAAAGNFFLLPRVF
jgi:hypothetical protein